MTKINKTLEDKIQAQIEKLRQLKAQKQAIEARLAYKKKKQQKSDETRMHYILGSFMLDKIEKNELSEKRPSKESQRQTKRIKKRTQQRNAPTSSDYRKKILTEFYGSLTNDRDRALFDSYFIGT